MSSIQAEHHLHKKSHNEIYSCHLVVRIYSLFTVSNNDRCRECLVLWWNSDTSMQNSRWYILAQTVYYFCVCYVFALPVFILTFTYTRIVKRLISDSLKLFASSHDPSAKLTLQLRKQVVRMLVLIVCLFFVSLCPIRIVTLWLIFTPTKQVESIGLEGYLNLLSFARIMMYINSAGNPLIYNLTSHKFKTAFQKVLKQLCSRKTSVSRKHAVNHGKAIYVSYSFQEKIFR